jgi:hypothetical protein
MWIDELANDPIWHESVFDALRVAEGFGKPENTAESVRRVLEGARMDAEPLWDRSWGNRASNPLRDVRESARAFGKTGQTAMAEVGPLHVCTECMAKFSTLTGLEIHAATNGHSQTGVFGQSMVQAATVHPDTLLQTCALCDFKTARDDVMQLHTKEAHIQNPLKERELKEQAEARKKREEKGTHVFLVITLRQTRNPELSDQISVMPKIRERTVSVSIRRKEGWRRSQYYAWMREEAFKRLAEQGELDPAQPYTVCYFSAEADCIV